MTWQEIENTATRKFLSLESVKKMKPNNQAFIARIQSKRDPSWAPQAAANL